MVAEQFETHRDRLARMVSLRMHPQLQGRLDPSDVLQEAYLDAHRRHAEYAKYPDMPVFVWLRLITAQKLIDLQRHHLGAQKRNAGREIGLPAAPEASSVSLARFLVKDGTSPSAAAARAESRRLVQEALDELSPMDREVLALRHFEHLSNAEAAAVLEIKPNAASNRYVRACVRLQEVLSKVPGIAELLDSQ